MTHLSQHFKWSLFTISLCCAGLFARAEVATTEEINRQFKLSRCLFILHLFLLIHLTPCFPETGLRETFETHYAAWKILMHERSSLELEGMERFGVNEEWWAMYHLGRQVIPFLMEKFEQEPEKCLPLEYLMIVLTKKRFEFGEVSKFSGYSVADAKACLKAYVYWWKHDRKNSTQKFTKYQSDLNLAKKNKDIDGKDKQLKHIRKLGLDVLPQVMNEIRNGETDLNPIVAFWTSNQLKMDATVEEAMQWWIEHGKEWVLPPLPEGDDYD